MPALYSCVSQLTFLVPHRCQLAETDHYCLRSSPHSDDLISVFFRNTLLKHLLVKIFPVLLPLIQFCVRQSSCENIRLGSCRKRISTSGRRTRGHSSKHPPFLSRSFASGFPPAPGHGTPVILFFAKKAPGRKLFRSRCLTLASSSSARPQDLFWYCQLSGIAGCHFVRFLSKINFERKSGYFMSVAQTNI